MPDLAEALATAVITDAAAKLDDIIETMKTARYLEDEALDNLAWRGDALLNHIAGHRALSPDDILLKLELWRRLPGDLWDTGPIIASIVTDLREFTQQSRRHVEETAARPVATSWRSKTISSAPTRTWPSAGPTTS